MRYLQISFLLIVTAFATGCPRYRPKVDFKNPNSFLGKLNDHLKVEQLKARCFSQNLDYLTPDTTNPTGCSSTPNSKPGGKELGRGIRNALVEDAVPYIDGMYMDFVTDLQQGRDRDNYLMDVVELAATAGIGIINGPQRSIQIIGIALTAFRGGRRSGDLNFYKDQATPVLINKMDDRRASVRAAMMQREMKDIDSYPVGMAITDIVEYYNSGTLVRAFTELQKDTAEQAKISERALAEAKRNLGVVGAPTAAQIDESKQNFAMVRRIIKVSSDAKTAEDNADKLLKIEQAKPAASQNGPEITKQTTEVAAQKKKQQDVLDDFRTLFDLILADSRLGPLVEQIPVRSSGGDIAEQQVLQASLNKIKNKNPNNPVPDIMDYNIIILALNGLVSEAAESDPSIRGRLKEMLSSSTTLKNLTP